MLEDLQNSQDSPTFILTADDTSETFDCEDGDLGEKACMVLKELGYTNVGLYPDGLSDWRMNGGQVRRGSPKHPFEKNSTCLADSDLIIVGNS